MYRIVIYFLLLPTLLFADKEQILKELYGVYGNYNNDSFSVNFAKFIGPDGRQVDELTSDINNDNIIERIYFIEETKENFPNKFRIVITSDNYLIIATTASFPSSQLDVKLSEVGIIPLFNNKKGIYVSLESTDMTVLKKFEQIYLLQDNIISLFYYIPSVEISEYGGIDLHLNFCVQNNIFYLVESPEYNVVIPDGSFSNNYSKCCWKIPGKIWFCPSYYGFTPTEYILNNVTYELNQTDIIYIYNLPKIYNLFPENSWVFEYKNNSKDFLTIWTAFLGHNFAHFVNNFGNFEPSFKVIGGITSTNLEFIIYIQDSEIVENKDMFRIFLSSFGNPAYLIDISVYPSMDSQDLEIDFFDSYSSSLNIKATTLSSSDRGVIILIEIPKNEFCDLLNTDIDLKIIKGFFKYRDFDQDNLTHLSIPSKSTINDPQSWGNILVGDVLLYE